MSNLLTVIVIGAYTIVYLIVFLIQKSQLDSAKETINSMKSFMDIFKVDEVKKYVELKIESANLEAAKFICDDERVRQTLDEIINKNFSKIKDIYAKSMKEEYKELYILAIDILKTVPEDRRIEFVKESLPKTGQDLLKIIEAEEKDELTNTQK